MIVLLFGVLLPFPRLVEYIANLNYTLFLETITNLNSAVVFATFLAIIFSSSSIIKEFRKFPKANMQLFAIIIGNSIIISLLSLLQVETGEIGARAFLSIGTITVSVVFFIVNVIYVSRIYKISNS